MLTHEFKTHNLFSEQISSTMDSNRHCMRRVVPHEEAEFSNHSIMKAMEKFVQAVQDMDETILVPSRLMDLEVGDASDTIELKPKGMSTDLYRLYTMVNCVKNELLWGANSDEADEEEHVPAVTTTLAKGHTRRPSTASVASTQSATLSDTDSETSNENDSGIEGESDNKPDHPDYTRSVETSFRRHLYGLQRSLRQMTAAAAYLTKRYQSDIGANL